MSITLTLTPNGRATVNETGRFLYLRHASAPMAVQLVSDLEHGHAVDIQLRRGELYDIGEQDNTVRFTRLELTNLSAQDNAVTLDIGFHRFRPAIDHSDINASITAVSVDVPVKLVEPATVAQIVEPVTVNTVTQIVEPITINKIKHPIQCIAATGPTALIDLGFHKIARPAKKNRLPGFNNDNVGEFSIPSNPNRAELIVTAHKDNWEIISVNGASVYSQKTLQLKVTDAVTIKGKVGERCFVSELVYV